MRKEFKEKILMLSIVLIGTLSLFVMCLRAEQIDTKKELSNQMQTEIR